MSDAIHPPCARLTRCASAGNVSRVHVDPDDANVTARMLWSSPGSGASWLRVLLELATGRSTNSVYYRDRHEKQAFCRQDHVCNSVLVKSHSAVTADCQGELERRPRLLLVRHPYGAIWSEYQRVAAATQQQHNHRPAVNGSGHNSHIASINTLQIVHLQYLLVHAKNWQTVTSQQRAFAASAPLNSSHWLFYEDLTDSRQQVAALRSAARFVGSNVVDRRLACAFSNSEDAQLHRPRGFSAAEALAAAEKERAQAASKRRRAPTATAEKTVHDSIWEIVHAEAEYFGFTKSGSRIRPVVQIEAELM